MLLLVGAATVDCDKVSFFPKVVMNSDEETTLFVGSPVLEIVEEDWIVLGKFLDVVVSVNKLEDAVVLLLVA